MLKMAINRFGTWSYHSLRFSLCAVFIWSGVSKLLDPVSFSTIIDAYGILPEAAVRPAAMALAGAEVLAAIGLSGDIRGSLSMIGGLLGLFMVVLGYGIWMGLDVDCGCFGLNDPEGMAFQGLRTALYRDMGMLLAVFWLFFWRFRRRYKPIRMKQIINNLNKEGIMRGMKIFWVTVVMVTMIATVLPVMADDKFEKEVAFEEGAVKLTREVTRGSYGLVTAAELKQWLDSKKEMLIVDTMPYEDSYKKAHVPGARQFLFPIPDMDEWNAAETAGKSEADYLALLGPDKERTLVVYCGFVKCTRSHNAGVWAKRLGYKNVYRFAGGIYAWRGAGFPVEGN